MSSWNVALAFICLFLCMKYSNGQTRTQTGENKAAIDSLNKGIEKFSLELILRTALANPDESVVLSPYSVWAMMSVLTEGARGNTSIQMKQVLWHPQAKEYIRRGFKAITEWFLVNTTTIQLESVNAIFCNERKQINSEFENLVRDYYYTKFQRINFQSPQSAKIINNYISQSTRNRVKEIVNADDVKSAEMIITNAVFFKGQWKYPFNASLTKPENFFNEQGKVIGQVNMMRKRAPFPFVNMKNFQSYIIELPYGKEERLSMMLILPYENVPLSRVYDKFTQINIEEIFKSLDNAKDYDDEDVDVYLPRFNINSDFTLNSILYDMGMWDVFEPAYSDLSGISRDLYLSRVLHKAVIEVNEEGTTAAAATAGELSNRNTPPKFVANKPFLYLLTERITKIIVFGGVYRVPELI